MKVAEGSAAYAGAVGGALRFARYAIAPNRLGYCGPTDHLALFEHAVDPPAGGSPVGARHRTDAAEWSRGLRALAAGFEGAWPYLELIAEANRIADPLDDRVVSAYWLGGPLLRSVGPYVGGNHVESRFRARAGRWWAEVASAIEVGFLANHAFHVMVVGPWVGMLRGGRGDAPLEVIDRCRIRRGKVVGVHGEEASVVTDRICYDSGRLRLGSAADVVTQRVRLGDGGRHPCGLVRVGDTVAIHWDWVCEVLTPVAAAALGEGEAAAIERANRALSVPGAPELG